MSEPQAKDRYAVGELAKLGGISRRTVRYYVQEGLIPPPFGRGRGRHYDGGHLAKLLRVKALQEQGLALGEIRALLASSGKKATANRPRKLRSMSPVALDPVRDEFAPFASADAASWALGSFSSAPDSPSRSPWTRVEFAPGIELHVSSDHRLPPPGRLRELAEWCLREFQPEESKP
jgi:DNA-binding transcriptional MerR regulator